MSTWTCYLKSNNSLTGYSKIQLTILLLGLLGIQACTLFQKEIEDEAVARVQDKYLYRSDLVDAIPEGSKPEDSVSIARSYIDTWVRNQLMLNRAEEALTDEQKDVNKKIEEYRSSLLIYTYRQKLLLQKLDTVIDENEILEYYDSNLSNFILKNNIIKATYVKVPLSAPNISNVRNWTRSGDMDDLDKLEKYCINYAEKFDMFNNSWIYFNILMEQVPLTITDPSRFLRYNRDIETSDSLFHYFVHITDYKLEGDVSPLGMIRNDIKSILLNKRKIEFYNNLDKQVYSEGANRNLFEIY